MDTALVCQFDRMTSATESFMGVMNCNSKQPGGTSSIQVSEGVNHEVESSRGNMRTTLRLTIAVLALSAFNLSTASVQAQFNFQTNNSTITITGYTGSGGAVNIPDTVDGMPVTRIGPNAFSRNTNLTSITLGNAITNIGQGAFSGCANLSSVTLGSGLAHIENVAFAGCSSLTSVRIPNRVALVEEAAFSRCSGLTNATLPASVTRIGDGAFGVCTNLLAIRVDPLNSNYCSVEGVLFDKGRTTLVEYPGGKKGPYTIPSGVTRLERLAFNACVHLTGVTIPDSVTNIGRATFGSCVSLSSLVIPQSVSRLGEFAFAGCHGLTNITVPDGLTAIEAGTFANCANLTEITIPASVNSIGAGAFQDCVALAEVFFQGDAPRMGKGVFGLAQFRSRQPSEDSIPTLYYLPGTIGWEASLGGRPTRLRNP